jgi:hypothetical protein
MPFSTPQPTAYGGIALHAHSLYVCILNHAGDIWLHRNRQASPETFLRPLPPSREEIGVAVEWGFTWYWLADPSAREGMPFVRGHALSMQAMHGGQGQTRPARRSPHCRAPPRGHAPASGCLAGQEARDP